ncbi:hypothetical protein GCT13_23140 [Paraburkholderia sp. CNPSo 3157]|uniref:Uncharacterized protein n=1 Tax=Paraburkholderia franconis TaxID=2654983 RepID=A0A7X1ND75_9BURK|nr:hypothetical protein [Paraburkholderia franconis]MPW19714.1 hypothetical protein [Paraburkholderia franconis]
MPVIARVIETLTEANAARDAVLRCGVPPDCVTLWSQADEAGGVRGNFLTGDCETGRSEPDEYDRRFKDFDTGARFTLSVTASDEQMPSVEAALAASTRDGR